ncbi:MAG: lysozyme [Elainella sp.]
MAYVLRPVIDTWLKLSTAQGSSLPDAQRQFANAGTGLPLTAFELVEDDHIKFTLGRDAQGNQLQFKGRNTWFVYRPAVQILRNGQVVSLPSPAPQPAPRPAPRPTPQPAPQPNRLLKALSDTWLKTSTGQSAKLPEDQKQLIAEGTTLPLSSYSPAENDHFRITLGRDSQGNQVQFKGRNTWFVYQPAVEILENGRPITPPPPAAPDRINSKGIRLLKSFEGLELKAYQDAVGVWTIGYGTTRGVRPGMVITEAQAEDLMKQDLRRFEQAIQDLVTVPLTSDQFSALVSFAYNVGEGALASSTLLRLLNQKNYQGAAEQFLRWDKAGGQALLGLTRRRRAERALFLGQDYTRFL